MTELLGRVGVPRELRSLEPGEANGATPSTAAEYHDAILAGDRRAMARAITLVESRRSESAALGQEILESLVSHTGKAIRVGVTGPPGVGKSTLIEALGLRLIEDDHRVAVLAVDPTSPVSGGSILGDKTRMERLAVAQGAFIRPSPSGGCLGGVAHRTREVMLLCEAAGYDVVLIETVGVGQSEVSVASMVDFFLAMLSPAGGDELQGIKRGVIELADAVVVNKADGAMRSAAERTRHDYEQALQLLRLSGSSWKPQALLASALEDEGIGEIWQLIGDHRAQAEESHVLGRRRREQNRQWMWSLVDDGIRMELDGHSEIAKLLPQLERDVEDQKCSPAAAARQLLDTLLGGSGHGG